MNKNGKHNRWGRNRNKRNGQGGRGGNSNRNNFQKKQYGSQQPPERLSEHEVGITEYISTLEGFSGIIKARFSDFHVSEIDLDGNVAKITDRQLPETFKVEKREPPKQTPIEEINQEKWDEILNMMQSKESISIKLDVTLFDKEKRSNLHKDIKNIFGEKIVSATVTEENNKFIELRRYSKENSSFRKQEWPENTGEYVHFLLYKECMDTMEAVMKIANELRVSASSFNYAGVKDRRAKTTQWISCWKVAPYKLLFKTKRIRNVQIGNLSFKDAPLKLGDLKGNHFKIALRNITVDDDVISKSLESLKTNGFINYYGLQRFGNDKEVPTYNIGIKLLQGNWKEACQLILKPKKCEEISDVFEAKKVYKETSDAKEACKKLCSNTSLESKLLQGLASSAANDYVNALESIPRNMRLLYIHAFQSFVWNQVVSKRINEFGLKPIVGDLVLINEAENLEDIDMEQAENTDINKAEEGTQKVDDDENKMECSDIEDEENESILANVKILGQSDLDKYTMYDIVLPLPGYNVVYPGNSLKDYYEEILGKYDLKLEMPKQKVKTYSLCGNYRKILGKPTEITWSIMKYEDPNNSLIRSDFEEYLKHKEPTSIPDGKYKGLIINFNLNSSSYATMVLREVLKIDTSVNFHTKLNNYHENGSIPKQGEEIVPALSESSLLTDKDKFEAFKKAIFETTESNETFKRVLEDENDNDNVKRPKLDEGDKGDKDSGIKIQPSLV